MQALMMPYQLTIPALARRAERLHPSKPIISRNQDRSLHRTTYAETLNRARHLAGALTALGIKNGDRVATLCWNHHQHFEAYIGIPSMGAVLHTLNLRLHASELEYIVNHAGDRVVIVDEQLLPLLDHFRTRTKIEHVIVIGAKGSAAPDTLDYESLIDQSPELPFREDIDENEAAAMCYTSGTTGRPKGVVYSHRSTVLHSLTTALWDVDLARERDVILPVVPMFHANAWGLPFTCLLVGSTLVFPGPHLDAHSLLELMSQQHVTVSAGVPTIWLAVLNALDAASDEYDLTSIRVLNAGGASVPEALIRAFQERHNITVVQGWGMTETSPVGSLATLTGDLESADDDTKYRVRATAGRLLPFVEARVQTDNGLADWDGETMGELEVRGPWVASAYYDAPESGDRFTSDGWFKTGDIVTIDPRGYLTIRDRSKDLIKSGGEWISSVALENALMKHPAVAEAAVVGLEHPTWDERPLALVVLRPEAQANAEQLATHLARDFKKFWIPNAFEFVPAIPRTSVGKVAKLALREQYQNYFTNQ